MGVGDHIMVDGQILQPLTCDYVEQFMAACVSLAGMTIIDGPKSWMARDVIIGWTILAESHVFVHASPRLAHIDVFSCMEFDVHKMTELITSRLGMYTPEVTHIKRGWSVHARDGSATQGA